MVGPYSLSAMTYYEAGFSPLPAIGKLLRVSGATGRHPIATREQVEQWVKTHGSFNVALRLPKNVIGLDIDAYKGDFERLRLLEEKLGKLPTSWNSDSRGGNGGKLLFRVPNCHESAKWKSNISDITIIQHSHRYVMALPSYNRESDSKYLWYEGLGGSLVKDFHIPAVNDLTELKEDWVAELIKEEIAQEASPMYGHINNDELDVFNDNEPCKYMNILTEMCVNRLIDSYNHGLHDTCLSIIGLLVTTATDGHSGVQQAMDKISEAFCQAPRNRDLVSEWNNLLEFVLAKVDVNSISETDLCDLSIVLENEVKDMIARLIAGKVPLGLIRRMETKRVLSANKGR